MVGDGISKGLREDMCSQEDVLRVRKASSYGVGWFQRTYIFLKDSPFYLKGAIVSLRGLDTRWVTLEMNVGPLSSCSLKLVWTEERRES